VPAQHGTAAARYKPQSSWKQARPPTGIAGPSSPTPQHARPAPALATALGTPRSPPGGTLSDPSAERVSRGEGDDCDRRRVPRDQIGRTTSNKLTVVRSGVSIPIGPQGASASSSAAEMRDRSGAGWSILQKSFIVPRICRLIVLANTICPMRRCSSWIRWAGIPSATRI
jgi:hypothetical protein